VRRLLFSVLLVCLAQVPVAFARFEVEVLALFKDRALLRTGGVERMLRVGETSAEGVTLLAANAQGARLRHAGRELNLGLSTQVAGRLAPPALQNIAIPPDGHGQYRVRGTIDGQLADFLVDTGASVVVLSSRHARALGIAFDNGRKGTVQTAQGTVDAVFLTLDRVAVAGIEARGIQATVIEGDYPVDILLGMTFLQHVSMEARAGVLTLTQKF